MNRCRREPNSAAERRENKAHGASRGYAWAGTGILPAPDAAGTGETPAPPNLLPSSPGLSRSGPVRSSLSAVSALALLIFAACRDATPPALPGVSDTAERGPLKLVVRAEPTELWVGDSFTVTVEMKTPEEFEVELPGSAELSGLTVREMQTPDPRPLPEGGKLWRRTFRVDTFVSGTLEIPPLVVKYRRNAAASQPAESNEIAAGTLKVEVRSALTTQDSVQAPRDITATLLPPPRRWTWWEWSLLGGALLAAVAAALLLVRWLRLRALRPPPPILPEVWAMRCLKELEAAGLVERGEARDYYYRLTEIVRAYVERKFALAAPEKTTEEFLTLISRDRGRLPYEADKLRAFLEACDMVKYAALQPRREDADAALQTARAFVNATAAAAERQVQPPIGPAARGAAA
ncbi:hypothetical protein RAS1_35700 [Phycisphaerae bacterium RAS1]|nr:hypothetical protein RAS1_35700 [Phycisphaerae bacterium RAS1]